jgi:hypothetical protein
MGAYRMITYEQIYNIVTMKDKPGLSTLPIGDNVSATIMKLIEQERAQFNGLVEAMKRLASVEAFAISRTLNSPYNDELLDRIKYAEDAVKPFLPPPPKLSEELYKLANFLGGPLETDIHKFADKARELEENQNE